MTSNRVYLDNAATTAIDSEVAREMQYWIESEYGNPSSIHALGRKTRSGIEDARKRVAKHLNASIGEIFFTSCGTEANNMVLKGAVRDLGVHTIISSPLEHHCVLHTLQYLERFHSTKIIWLPLCEQGVINLDDLEQALQNSGGGHQVLVSLMHANNEIGNLLDLEATAECIKRHGALFHTDTVQTIGYFSFDLNQTPIDFLAGSAHKFYGPKGSGFLYLRHDHGLGPLLDGGGQERNMRAGTENVYGIMGLAKALDLAYENQENRMSYLDELRTYLKTKLTSRFPEIVFLGDQINYHPKILSAGFPAHPKNELLLLNLDIQGISASGGSACTSGAEVESHVLNEIQVDPDVKAIRFSFSHKNTRQELDWVLNQLENLFS